MSHTYCDITKLYNTLHLIPCRFYCIFCKILLYLSVTRTHIGRLPLDELSQKRQKSPLLECNWKAGAAVKNDRWVLHTHLVSRVSVKTMIGPCRWAIYGFQGTAHLGNHPQKEREQDVLNRSRENLTHTTLKGI